MWDKNKAMQGIMQKKRPEKTDTISEAPKPQDPVMDLHSLVAREIMSAVHEKNVDKFHNLMKSYIDLHLSNQRQESEPKPKK